MTTEHLRFLKKFRRRRRMVVFLRILILFLFLLQWEICADTGVVDSFIFSSPSRIITCFLKMTEDGSVFHHIGITLYETLVSFLLVDRRKTGVEVQDTSENCNGHSGNHQ